MKKGADKSGRHISEDNGLGYLREGYFTPEIEQELLSIAKRLKKQFPVLELDDVLTHVKLFRHVEEPVLEKENSRWKTISTHNTWSKVHSIMTDGFKVLRIRVDFAKPRAKNKSVVVMPLPNTPNEELFFSFFGLLDEGVKHLYPTKLTKLGSAKVYLLKRFGHREGGMNSMADDLLLVLKKKERVYDYLSEMLNLAAPSLFDQVERTRKSLKNHLKF